MNQLSIIGRFVNAVDLKVISDGRSVLNNTIAVQKSYKTGNGQDADFIPIVAWGKRAELIHNYCKKGDRVGLNGRLQSRTFENKNGDNVFVVEMVVDQIHFLQPKAQKETSESKDSAVSTS